MVKVESERASLRAALGYQEDAKEERNRCAALTQTGSGGRVSLTTVASARSRIWLIDHVITVIVDAVSRDLLCRSVGVSVRVVTVTIAVRTAAVVAIQISILIQVEHLGFVGAGTAVIVESVTDLDLSRIDARQIIIAIRRIGDVVLARLLAGDHNILRPLAAVSVAVLVDGPLDGVQRIVLVDVAVAVVIDLIAKFVRVRIDVCISVVAVAAVLYVSVGRIASLDRLLVVSIAVFVVVRMVVAVGESFIHRAVAVVVHLVAQFGGLRRNFGIRVVTVTRAHHPAIAVFIDLVYAGESVAVVVNPVARLAGSGEHGRVPVVTVARAAVLAIPICIEEIQARVRIVAVAVAT